MSAPWRIVSAAWVYAAVVFAVGFVLGSVRVLVSAPRLGDLAATLLELPVMLAVSWAACGAALRRFDIAGRSEAAGMGLCAFALLMAAELILSVFGFGRTLGQHFSAYATAAGAIGLAGQVAFGIMPLVRAPGEKGLQDAHSG